jgi:UPF0716 protein FxsA
MVFVAVLVFIAAEIAAFVGVASEIGLWWALALLVIVSALGPMIVRHVGTGVLAHTQQRLAGGEVPTRELLDGLVVLIGGAMICVPGFITDALGLLLMIGPVRHAVIRVAGHRLARRVQTFGSGRWQMVNVRSRPVDEGAPPPASGAPGRSLGPGGD